MLFVCLIVRHGDRDPFRGRIVAQPPPNPPNPPTPTPASGGYYLFRDAMTPLGDRG